MRTNESNGTVSVRAIAGAQMVLLAFDITEDRRSELLGFAVWRKAATGEWEALTGDRHFANQERVEPTPATDAAPVQAFQWNDYVVQPDTTYTISCPAGIRAPYRTRTWR